MEIVVIDGRLDVIETKKPKKVSQILTSERYQPKFSKGIACYIRTAHPG